MSDHDVIVIGGGPSGLAAARALHRAGRDVVVLEARDRVGGRTWSRELGDTTIDIGGQWVGPTQHRLLALIDELGLTTDPTPVAGRSILMLDGRPSTYSGTIPNLPLVALVQLQRILWATDRLARKVPASSADSDRDIEWDTLSLADWTAARRIRPDVDAVLRAGMRVVFGLEAEEVPFLRFLQYAKAAGGAMPLVDTEDGAQDARVVGGMQQVSQRMAAELGDHVVLEAPVERVEVGTGVVTVTTRDGRTFRGTRAVPALPPNLAAKITWEPGLSDDRRAWLAGHQMGTTLKTHVQYERAFWTERGLSGEVVFAHGPVDVAFDNTNAGGPPALVVFATGERGRRLGAMTEHERREAIVGALVSAYGEDAASPTVYFGHDWDVEEFSGGCPVATLAVAAGPRGFDPTEPEGPLHWAGTESSTVWRGYIDGALAAGERAAQQILT